jgi:5,10-methylene-tetrahydrofolate dehydrogenase/methenyl tetrahydrofolate cyclohydrolase
MTRPQRQLRLPGRALLREVLDAYQPYRQALAEPDTRVAILRFTPTAGATDTWRSRTEAARISAEQKVRVFTALGAQVDSVTLPDTATPGELADRIQAANADPRVAAIIVQTPPPPRLRDHLDQIDPAKDIDALGASSHRSACATADGIARIAEPFLDPDTRVAVVGARGFVGAGVVRLLREHGHDPQELDFGADLRQLRDADVVLSTTGSPGLLTPEHLHAGQRLVVDSGFVPSPDGPRGDVHPDAQHLPAAITPVPGGIGPVEMAILAERLTTAQAAPDLASWRYLGSPVLDTTPNPETSIALDAGRTSGEPSPRLTDTHRTVTDQLQHSRGNRAAQLEYLDGPAVMQTRDIDPAVPDRAEHRLEHDRAETREREPGTELPVQPDVEPEVPADLGGQPLREPEPDRAAEQAREAAAAAERERQERTRTVLAEARRFAEAPRGAHAQIEAGAAVEQASEKAREAIAAAEAERARQDDAQRREQLIRWHEQDRAAQVDQGRDQGMDEGPSID